MGKVDNLNGIDVNKSALQVLRILTFFNGKGEPQSVADVVGGLQISRNMAYRALQTLADAGYVYREPKTKQYILSPAVIGFMKMQPEDIDIRSRCHPYLVQLHELTGESAFLSIVAGYERVNIDSVEAAGRKVTYGIRGRAVPLHTTITSKVLLAYLSSRQVDDYLDSEDFKRLKEVDPVDTSTLREELRLIQKDGYGVGTSQGPLVHLRARYVCFPVLDADDRLHGAISIGGPLERFTLERVEKIVPTLKLMLSQLKTELAITPNATSFSLPLV